jgi:hypothetical protein
VSASNSNFKIKNPLEVLVANGVAPIVVNTTTVVANLNAGLVDGYHASASILANAIPVRDASGAIPGDITGTAATAVKLATARTIAVSGDVSGSGSFDGSANLTIAAILANSGVAAGNYTKLTVDAKGRVTAGATLVIADIPSLDWSKITTGKPTSLAGYGITDAIPLTQKGAVNGVATLDAAGLVPTSQLPSYVDDILEYATYSVFPTTGELGKIYIDLSTNKTYRWSGSVYVYITSGAVDSVNGKTGIVVLAKADIGLGNADNTADSVKSVASAAKWTTARTLAISGDASGSASVDGSANATISVTLANSGVTAGIYNNSGTTVTPLTIDAKGRVTATGTPIVITPAWSSIAGRPTTTGALGLTDFYGLVTGIAPTMDSYADVGTSLYAAHADHRHPSDTSRAAIDQTCYIGTTPIALNRASGTLTLSSVSITGNAGTVTSGVYLTGEQNISGVKTFTADLRTSEAAGMRVGTSGTITGGIEFLGETTSNGKTGILKVAAGLTNNQSWTLPNATGTIAINGQITEAHLLLSDNTTGNFSTTKHGLVPKATSINYFLKGDGTWSPVDGGDASYTSVFFSNGKIFSSSYMSSDTTANQVIVQMPIALFRSAQFLIQSSIAVSGHFHTTTIHVAHNNTVIYLTEYGTMYDVSTIASFDADISAGNMRLLVTPFVAGVTFNVVTTAINTEAII